MEDAFRCFSGAKTLKPHWKYSFKSEFVIRKHVFQIWEIKSSHCAIKCFISLCVSQQACEYVFFLSRSRSILYLRLFRNNWSKYELFPLWTQWSKCIDGVLGFLEERLTDWRLCVWTDCGRCSRLGVRGEGEQAVSHPGCGALRPGCCCWDEGRHHGKCSQWVWCGCDFEISLATWCTDHSEAGVLERVGYLSTQSLIGCFFGHFVTIYALNTVFWTKYLTKTDLVNHYWNTQTLCLLIQQSFLNNISINPLETIVSFCSGCFLSTLWPDPVCSVPPSDVLNLSLRPFSYLLYRFVSSWFRSMGSMFWIWTTGPSATWSWRDPERWWWRWWRRRSTERWKQPLMEGQ